MVAPEASATWRIRSSSSVRGTAEPVDGNDGPGQSTCTVEPKPAIRRPVCRMCSSTHGPRPSSRNSATARGVRPSPHALSRGNVAASMSTTSRPSSGGPRGGGRPRGTGADDGHVDCPVLLRGHAAQYVGPMPTPVSVVAGVDFGDAVFAERARDGVARIEALMETELGRADELMSDAVQHLFLAGGKRFRPLFTVLSASLGPDPDSSQVTIAGAVIEMVHLATLYHDDVMDEAQVRRGAPSANARWSNNIAILAGDYLFATASRLVSRLGPEAVLIIADTFAELVTGQMRETRGVVGGRRRGRPLPQGRLREDRVPDRRLRPVRGNVLRRRRRSGRAAEPARRHCRHRVPDLRRHHRHRERSRRVRQTAGHRSARGCAHACRCSTRCGKPGRPPTGCASCSTGRWTTIRWPRRSRCCGPPTAFRWPSRWCADYAERARDELAALPDGPGRQALASLVDYTVNRHG